MKRLLFFLIFLLSCGQVWGGSKTFNGSAICEDAGMIRITPKDNFGDRFFGAEPPTLHFVELGTYNYAQTNWIRMLIRFRNYEDSIPTGQQIDSAFLELYYF